MSTPFSRYIGIDYSGAKSPACGLRGLRVFLATPADAPREIHPTGRQKHWSRRAVAEWLLEILDDMVPTQIGIDHGFSFPLAYFEQHRLPQDWEHFLQDFCRHWPTDVHTVDDVRKNRAGHGAQRTGNSRWRRLCEQRSSGAKSVFHFDVPGSVAKSTHAGLPWLALLRKTRGASLHFWPFDGWEVPVGKSVIAEVYPSLWNRIDPPEDRSPDQHDAYCIARWLRETDAAGDASFFTPALTPEEQRLARVEGWILGVAAK
jgi:hypothetical protein